MQLAAYTRLGRDYRDQRERGNRLYHVPGREAEAGRLHDHALNDVTLVDRNALEISKSTENSGQCKITISDTAPPIGPRLYLPIIRQ